MKTKAEKPVAVKKIPKQRMSLDTSFGSTDVGSHASTMRLFFHDGQAGSGCIEWHIPGLQRTEYIGILWNNDKELIEYDGIFSLPDEAISLLESKGFKVSKEFRV